jgi:hypothetical protein
VQDDKPLEVYQASFDTVKDDWVNVKIPWHEFVAVDRAKVKAAAPPLDTSQISTIGLVYSRFDFNGFANPNFKPGATHAPSNCSGSRQPVHVAVLLHPNPEKR